MGLLLLKIGTLTLLSLLKLDLLIGFVALALIKISYLDLGHL
jgi:hypothetical protein